MTTRRRRTMSSPHGACTSSSPFPFWCLDSNGGEDSYPYHFSFQCVMDLSSMCGARGGQEPFLHMACKTFYGDLNLFTYLSMFGRYLCLSILYD
jgi:hypothetical protein